MRKLGITLAVASVAGFGLVGPGSADNEFKNKYGDETVTRDCGDGNTVVLEGPTKLWPPNHKLQDLAVTATDGSGDEVTLTVVPDPAQVAGGEKGSGGPQHDPDVFLPNGPSATGTPSATVPVQLRSERSGLAREGRTYVLHWEADFDGLLPNPCSSMDADQAPFEVLVPHDMRGGADWK